MKKTPTIINGIAIARDITKNIGKNIQLYKNKYSCIPGLAVVLVGNQHDSATYVRMKQKAAHKIGMNFYLKKFNENAKQHDIATVVDKLNKDPNVHGIIIQLPLPKHINDKHIYNSVLLEKDVDGLKSENIGKLAVKGQTPTFVACTPKGCIELLKQTNTQISGKNTVVVGCSNIVGLPLSLLLLHKNATITICHKQTTKKDLVDHLKKADIVIVAVGKSKVIKGEWLKPGATVIDVGINNVASSKHKNKIVGDVDFKKALQHLGGNGYITPVPGGVGPMTVAMLLSNTFDSFERYVHKLH